MSAVNGINAIAAARKTTDARCAKLNEAVGVDQCATIPDTLCIDMEAFPSRCVDLSQSSVCFIGRESHSKICVYQSQAGPYGYGVDYCKKNYCIRQVNSLRVCDLLQDAFMLRAKEAATSLCNEADLPGMSECSMGLCLHPVTLSCVRITG